MEDPTNGVAHRRRYLPEPIVLGCIAFTSKRSSLFSENALREKSLTTCSIHFCPCFHRVANDLHEITYMNMKLLGQRLTVVEVEVFTYVSIHVRLSRNIMSKYCFLLAP